MKIKLEALIAFTVLFLVFFTPLTDTDFGWHLRCGEMIVKSGTLCHQNEFTTLLSGYEWSSPAHGYQALIYLIYKFSGFFGLSLFYALSASLVFGLFLLSLEKKLLLNLLLLLAGIAFAWGILGLGFRSQVLSVYFFSLFLTLVELSQKSRKYLYGLPLLMLVWANSHPGFFLGSLLSILLAVKFFLLYLQKKVEGKEFLIVSGIAGLNILTTLFNPYGLSIYNEVLRHTTVPLKTLIAEWVPPLPWQINTVLILGSFIVLLLLIKRSTDLLRILLLATAMIFSSQARRNLPLFSLAAVYALADPLLTDIKLRLSKILAIPEVLSIALTIVLLLTVPRTIEAFSFNDLAYCQKALVPVPCRAVEFMKTQKPGNIFNAYEWGGFLIWKLPSFKIFADGRMPSWDTSHEERLPEAWRGKSPYTIYIETLQYQPGWDEVLRNYQTDYVMIQPGTFLDLLLKSSDQYGFRQIYNDGVAVIYRRI